MQSRSCRTRSNDAGKWREELSCDAEELHWVGLQRSHLQLQVWVAKWYLLRRLEVPFRCRAIFIAVRTWYLSKRWRNAGTYRD
jgi:hypothetical protein